jgi:hypothetical protein
MSVRSIATSIVGGLLATILLVRAADAGTITFNFTGSGSNHWENGLTITSGGHAVTATGWALTGGTNGDTNKLFVGGTTNVLRSYGSFGIGVCSGPGDGDPTPATGSSCNPTESNEHQVENDTRYEFVLFILDQTADIDSILIHNTGTVNGGAADMDVTYWLGVFNDPGDLLAGDNVDTFAALRGLTNGPTFDPWTTADGNPTTVAFANNSSTALLIGTSCPDQNDENGCGGQENDGTDGFKVKSLTVTFADPPPPSTAPAPAAIGLVGAGLVLLAFINRRRRV